MNYAFIGLGNMAGAILRGMKASGRFDDDALYGFDVDRQKAEPLAEAVGLHLTDTAAEAVGMAQAVVLAVKPQTLAGLLKALKSGLSRGQLVISIAAGKPLSFYEGILGNEVPLIRVMPSINAKAGAACSALCKNARVSGAQLAAAMGIFSAVGTVSLVSEHLFPAFSAIAAAAPAFVFQFIDALASAGVKAGLSRELALLAACETTLGSAMLLKQSKEHPRQLMDQVCSPGGTTIEGVHRLDKLGFEDAVHEAVTAVIEKDIRLGKQEGS